MVSDLAIFGFLFLFLMHIIIFFYNNKNLLHN